MSDTPIRIVVGVCEQDDPADVDEAYGAGTYRRLFPLCDECGCRPCECEADRD